MGGYSGPVFTVMKTEKEKILNLRGWKMKQTTPFCFNVEWLMSLCSSVKLLSIHVPYSPGDVRQISQSVPLLCVQIPIVSMMWPLGGHIISLFHTTVNSKLFSLSHIMKSSTTNNTLAVNQWCIWSFAWLPGRAPAGSRRCVGWPGAPGAQLQMRTETHHRSEDRSRAAPRKRRRTRRKTWFTRKQQTWKIKYELIREQQRDCNGDSKSRRRNTQSKPEWKLGQSVCELYIIDSVQMKM